MVKMFQLIQPKQCSSSPTCCDRRRCRRWVPKLLRRAMPNGSER